MFDPFIAETRFGTGVSPRRKPPASIDHMLVALRGPDVMAKRFPIEGFSTFKERILSYNEARRVERKQAGSAAGRKASEQRKSESQAARAAYDKMFRNALLRRVHTATGLNERLSFFWADHFTARGKSQLVRFATSPYIEEAIRPHIAGKFEDMLIAAITHPLMLYFLNQNASVGPNSRVGKQRGLGLNENLAREALELHTLGVDGPYSQQDVRQLAELFTGLTVDRDIEFFFRKQTAEPGAEQVLGKVYGPETDLSHVHAVLRDLARHPATARHISRKLARHFIADAPDTELVTHMTGRYLETDGSLFDVYAAMLSHPASWQAKAQNVKAPIDFVSSAMRALNINAPMLTTLDQRTTRAALMAPMELMGQPWEQPLGPDGWPEGNEHWINPQFMAARVSWALSAPQAILPKLPDPRDFARKILGPVLTPEVAFAAEAAENRWEGIALVLVSPAFQRF